MVTFLPQCASMLPFHNSPIPKAIMVMPLVGFDECKNRLGYGGGFYDRYIQNNPEMLRIALAYECQKYETVLPVEETDKKPDFILTERHTIKNRTTPCPKEYLRNEV